MPGLGKSGTAATALRICSSSCDEDMVDYVGVKVGDERGKYRVREIFFAFYFSVGRSGAKYFLAVSNFFF
jgi:hypothetical protein